MDRSAVNRDAPPARGGRHPGPPWGALVLFALAFGFVEAALVVDLRSFLDPTGERFPLVRLPDHLIALERARELATLVLLASAAALVRACRAARFATFLFVFGLWDLAYYAALRLLLGWPPSLAAWDLLFLLPVPWHAPVYAPVAISLVMGIVGVLTWRVEQRVGCFRVRPRHLVGAALGGAVCIGTFVFHAPARALEALPERYPVGLLVAGLALAVAAYVDAWRFNRPASG